MGGENVITFYKNLCNEVQETNEQPEDWKTSLIVTQPNKGDLTHCVNYMTMT